MTTEDEALAKAGAGIVEKLLRREATTDAERWLDAAAVALRALADSGKYAATGGLSHATPQGRYQAAVIDALICLDTPDIWLRQERTPE